MGRASLSGATVGGDPAGTAVFEAVSITGSMVEGVLLAEIELMLFVGRTGATVSMGKVDGAALPEIEAILVNEK